MPRNYDSIKGKIQDKIIHVKELKLMASSVVLQCNDKRHQAPLNGYCSSCKSSVCKDCVQKTHFDHIESIESKSNDQAATINFLTKLKASTSKALHLHSAVIKNIDIEDIVKAQKIKVEESYVQLDLFLKQHIRALLWKIRLCRYVEKIRSMYNESKSKRSKLEQSRADYMIRSKKLLEASLKGKYDESLIVLAKEEELDRQQKEMDSYKSLVEELKKYVGLVKGLEGIESKYTQESVKVRDVCQLNIGEIPTRKIGLMKENSSKLIAYCMNTRKIEEQKIEDYTAPMNYTSVELNNILYIIGGNIINERGFNTFLDKVTSISLNDGTWKVLRPLVEARRRAAAVSIGNKFIYVMGGDRDADMLKSCEKFDVYSKEWSTCPSLSEEKTNVSAGVFRGKIIYIFGGYNKTSNDLNTIERLDTEKGAAWERVALNLDSVAQNMGIIQISYNEMLLFGGLKNSNLLTQSFILKVDEGKLEKTEDLKKAESFSMVCPKAIGYTIVAIGSHSNDLHSFDSRIKKWTIKEYTPK